MRFPNIVLMCVVFTLVGCRSNPTYDTLTTLLPWKKQYAPVQPGFEYLWVSVAGRVSLMALGERKVQGKPPDERVHEYWYTGQGEMLYLLNGRIQEAKGFTHEWRAQNSAPPAWADLLTSQRALTWRRQLDVMPGYQYGVVTHITSYPIATPKSLPEGVSAQARWVEDAVDAKTLEGRPWRYTQRFAVLDGRVVYSEQCVADSFCLKLRPMGLVVATK
jgi:hypothetical protein